MSKTTAELLEDHVQKDTDRFDKIYRRLGRLENLIYGLYVAGALFVFFIEHPQIIQNLTAPASAEEVKWPRAD